MSYISQTQSIIKCSFITLDIIWKQYMWGLARLSQLSTIIWYSACIQSTARLCVYLGPMFYFIGPCEMCLQCTQLPFLWSIAWESYKESLIHFAFKFSHNTHVKYDLVCLKCHPLCLSQYTTKYNLWQLLSSTGHPLNISLFFNKDWSSSSFVTVSDKLWRWCWSAHYCIETEM